MVKKKKYGMDISKKLTDFESITFKPKSKRKRLGCLLMHVDFKKSALYKPSMKALKRVFKEKKRVKRGSEIEIWGYSHLFSYRGHIATITE